MELNLNNMVSWERQKALYLLRIAEYLGMDTSGYGAVGVNRSSGNTYIWLEDYPFTLFMPINCELRRDDIQVLWTNPEDGEEYTVSLGEKNLEDLEEWTRELWETKVEGDRK